MLKFSLQNSLQSLESYFWYGAKGCRYMVIWSNECQICLLIDFGY